MSSVGDYSRFLENTNLILVLDHNRAGNSFFLSIFDQHEEVLCCPFLHYTYSYIVSEFQDTDVLDVAEVKNLWTEKYYFRLIYKNIDKEIAAFLRKLGVDPMAPIDREKIRSSFDAGLFGRETITRRELVLLTFWAFGQGTSVDFSKIKYILVSDSISLRTEDVMDGFSGKATDVIVADFPNAKLVHLIRDPRACFSSVLHQFTNVLGNIHGVRWGRFWSTLGHQFSRRFDRDHGFVFGFWVLYFSQAFLSATALEKKYPQHFIRVKNEDLNLDFVATIKNVCRKLNVTPKPVWSEQDYEPTILGRVWRDGGSAYANVYQTNTNGLVENDPDHVSRNIKKPNAYVTQRWKSRLTQKEIYVLECLFYEELKEYAYPFQSFDVECDHRSKFLHQYWSPFTGELASIQWLWSGRRDGLGEVMNRIFYALTSPVFYVFSRWVLLRIGRETNILSSSAPGLMRGNKPRSGKS